MTAADRAAGAARAEVLHDADELQAAVDRLAGEIVATHGPEVVLVVVLKGSLLFAADLLRSITRQGGGGAVVDMLAVSAYAPGQVRVRMEKDLDIDVRDRPVVLVEDIVDTGLTVGYLRDVLARRSPSSLAVCTLFDKAARRILPIPLDHVGFEAPDRFLVGYGLDYRGRYRNLPLVAAGDHDRLRADPDCYVAQLHGRPVPGRELAPPSA